MKMVDLCMCEICHTLSLRDIINVKPQPRVGFCPICHETRNMLPVHARASGSGTLVLTMEE